MQPDDASRPATDPNTLTDERLGAALGRIPSGLFIVTWHVEGSDRAMLASWATQAGFAPPLISVAVGVTRDLLAAIRGGGAFVVNVLSDSQRGLLGRFGKPPAPGEDPFAGLPTERTGRGIVVLADAAAWLECEPVAESLPIAADHALVLGRVTAAGGRTDLAPLIHVRRNGLKY